MASASLVVRISADINDFSRQLNKMTRDVSRAAESVASIGKAMTIGITLPVTLAAVALGRMGAENEAVANKMNRSFGPSVQKMNALLTQLGKIAPETGTDLAKMAIQTQDFARGLGMAAPKAELLTEQVLKLAADVSAAKFISMNEALDVVQKGLEGQTRGLKSVGIVIEQAQVKQEAYRLGLLKVGQELTPLGTALATYSLLVKQSGNLQGEAAAQHADAGRQLAFLKRDFLEFADATSNLLIPALRLFAKVGREVVGVLNSMPDWLRTSIMAFAGMLAVLGPTIVLMAKLTTAVTTLRAAIILLSEGSALAKFIGLLTSPEILLAIAAIAVAVGGAVALWKKFHKEVAEEQPKIEPLVDVKALMGGGATSFDTKNPLQEFQTHAHAVMEMFDQATKAGDPLKERFQQIVDLNKEALALYSKQADKLSETALAARAVVLQTQEIVNLRNAMTGFNEFAKPGTLTSAIGAASRTATPQTQISMNLARGLIDQETTLRTREAALRLANTFNATREASLALGERFRQTSNEFREAIASFKQQTSSMSAVGSSMMSGLQAGISGVISAFGPYALAVMAVGKVMQGLSPVIDKLMGPLVALGQIIADLITPILKPMFLSLKSFGIAVAFVGEVIYTVASGISRFVGNLIVAIGKFISKIPGLGSVGHRIQDAGNGMISLADSMAKTAKQLDRDRIDLQNLDFNDAANGLQSLADSAQSASEALTNVPQAFKIALRRFQATAPISYEPPVGIPGTPTGNNGSGSGGGGGGGGGSDPGGGGDNTEIASASDSRPVANINIDGRTVAQITVGHLRAAANRQFGDASRISDVTRVY